MWAAFKAALGGPQDVGVRVLVVGPPAAGKGTVCEALIHEFQGGIDWAVYGCDQ